MQTELKPCPFCGSAAQMENVAASERRVTVGCSNEECFANVPYPFFNRDADAISAWNTRAHIDALEARSAPRVRQIEWMPNHTSGPGLYSGELILHTYYTIDQEGQLWRVYRDQFLSEVGSDEVGATPDLEAAKALAQADYTARIISALEPT